MGTYIDLYIFKHRQHHILFLNETLLSEGLSLPVLAGNNKQCCIGCSSQHRECSHSRSCFSSVHGRLHIGSCRFASAGPAFFGTAAVYFLILHVPAGEAGMGCQSAEPWMSLGQLMQVSQPAGKPGLPRGRRAAVPGRHLGGGTRCPWRTA